MDVKVTIHYQTDNEDVYASVNEILANTLPYMADNIVVSFEVEE
jgi:cold shock CspA family protein